MRYGAPHAAVGRAIGAVVAQQLYTLWVGGSNPSSPTRFEKSGRPLQHGDSTMKNVIRVLLMLALAGVTSASADVLIYQFRSVSKNIGEGVEFTSSARGY